MLIYFSKDIKTAQTRDSVVQCAECRKYKNNGKWTTEPPYDLTGKGVTHGICDECLPKVYQRIQESTPEMNKLFGPPHVKKEEKKLPEIKRKEKEPFRDFFNRPV